MTTRNGTARDAAGPGANDARPADGQPRPLEQRPVLPERRTSTIRQRPPASRYLGRRFWSGEAWGRVFLVLKDLDGTPLDFVARMERGPRYLRAPVAALERSAGCGHA